MPYLQNAASFIVETLCNLALYIVLIRFWMQWARADFRNQFGQFIIKATNPVVIPIRRIIPAIGKIDSATVIFAIALAILKLLVLQLIFGGGFGNISILKLLILAIGVVIESSIFVFMGAIIIGIIASWVNPGSYHPILSIAHSISEPIMAPARRILPPMGGIDFSPMLVFLFLGVLRILLVGPIYGLNI